MVDFENFIDFVEKPKFECGKALTTIQCLKPAFLWFLKWGNSSPRSRDIVHIDIISPYHSPERFRPHGLSQEPLQHRFKATYSVHLQNKFTYCYLLMVALSVVYRYVTNSCCRIQKCNESVNVRRKMDDWSSSAPCTWELVIYEVEVMMTGGGGIRTR